MTEAEWLACTDPMLMLAFLQGKVSSRKFRLFALACCQRGWPLLDEHTRTAVAVAERHVDEEISIAHIWATLQKEKLANHRLSQALVLESPPWGSRLAELRCGRLDDMKRVISRITGRVFSVANDSEAVASSRPGEEITTARATWLAASQAQAREEAFLCGLIRDITGNRFPTVQLGPWSRTPKVAKAAQSIYDHRAFDRLPTLADALEDVGCDNADILAHCRGPEPHVRGCWVVDLLLGKK